MKTKDAVGVLIDEAELVLLMFATLTGREGVPKGPAREALDRIEAMIDEAKNGHDQLALVLATDMTKLAMEWFMGKINAQSVAEGKGELARKISREEARQ